MSELNEQLRAEFEAHIKTDPLTKDWIKPAATERAGDGYFYGHVNIAWNAWQAALATPAPQAAPSTPTELEHRLRETADQQPGWKPLLTAAADEIKRLRTAVTQASPSEPVARLEIREGIPDRDRMFIDVVKLGNNGIFHLYTAPSSPQQAQADARMRRGGGISSAAQGSSRRAAQD